MAYKLTYFDGRGIAETARFLFSYGEIEFEDIRIKDEEWPDFKSNTPYHLLPILEHNGQKITESTAIARYLAKKVKLMGNDDWENLEIDSVVCTINELYLKILPLYNEKDEDKKKALTETLIKETCPFYLSRFEALVKKNGGYIVVGHLTWADFYWATLSLLYDVLMEQDVLANYPNLKALREKVNELPAIKKWIAKRPKSDW